MQKIEAASPEAKSPNLVAENLAALRALFPELITEGTDRVAVNLDVLTWGQPEKMNNKNIHKYK